MRVPVSVWRNLAVGGATMALAVGCAKPHDDTSASPPNAAWAERTGADGSAKNAATTRGDEAGRGDSPRGDASRSEASRSDDVRDDREVPANAWFLQHPGQPSPNEPASTQTPSEPPKPVVAQTPPKPVVRPQPTPTPHWSIRAACGRG